MEVSILLDEIKTHVENDNVNYALSVSLFLANRIGKRYCVLCVLFVI
jgi:hypothetical protein